MLSPEATKEYLTFFKNINPDILNCGDLSFLFCSILVSAKINPPYKIISGFFDDKSVHTVCYALGTTIDPMNNLYIPNFKFTYDKYNMQDIQPIFKQLPYNEKWFNYYKHSYNDKILLKRNIFTVLEETT